MKQFFGAFFGSIVGMIVATLLSVLLVVALVKAGISSAMKDDKEQTTVTQDNSVLRLKMEGELEDRERENPFKELGNASKYFSGGGMGLNTLLRKIETAKRDSNIKGIYICFKEMRTGFASLQELRDAIKDFSKSGKFVYAYAEDFSQQE